MNMAVDQTGQDGSTLWGPHAVPGGGGNSGPPTIADFDGDTLAEIGTAGGHNMVVFDPDGPEPVLWQQPTKDTSSAVTGSTVFDFEGDGKAEVVYSDELQLRIYEGNTGKVLFSHCNTSGTLCEYPVIVDVDNDTHAEIVVANNNYAFKTCSDGSASRNTFSTRVTSAW